MAEFNLKNLPRNGEPGISVLYDEDAPLAFAPAAPPIGKLIKRMQALLDSGELTVGQLAILAA
ncbi:MAG TPA: hypothetical protein VFH37_01915 [Candidatus Saccharimonadales bacterium]|nr:hypothetical protein [Candidatus Saccharimonadales bacterium]